MGYVEETGAAQFLRDIRIAAIYEGTNGIQGQDLVMRKLGADEGSVFSAYLTSFDSTVEALASDPSTKNFADQLSASIADARRAADWLLAADTVDRLGGATPFLRLLGTTVCGALCGTAALAARARLADESVSDAERTFFESKIVTARFFGEQILPSTSGLAATTMSGSNDLFAMAADTF